MSSFEQLPVDLPNLTALGVVLGCFYLLLRAHITRADKTTVEYRELITASITTQGNHLAAQQRILDEHLRLLTQLSELQRTNALSQQRLAEALERIERAMIENDLIARPKNAGS